jgi:TRAP transporter TAXI family solute receptor
VAAVQAPLPALAPGDPGPCTEANASRPYPAGKLRLVIGTGGTGGVFFPYGGGLARILSARLARAEVTAEVTGGSVDNNKLLFVNEADLALTTADSAYDALRGDGAYRDTGPIPLCSIATLYTSFVHVVALDEPGLRGLPDLRGRRVSVGSAGSSTETAAERLLAAAGLDPQRDVTRDNLSVAESVNALRDGKIEAFFWIGGVPTAAVTDLVSTPRMKLRFLPTDAYIPALRASHGPLYTAVTLPRSSYAGLQADVPGTAIGNALLVHAGMSSRLVYDLLAALFDHLDEVRAIHREASSLTPQGAASGSAVPFHPGAIAFYRERGFWVNPDGAEPDGAEPDGPGPAGAP